MKMRLKILSSVVILSCFTTTSLVSSQIIVKNDNYDKSTKIDQIKTNINTKPMLNSKGVYLRVSQFIARDDKLLPTGMLPQCDRVIGRATVFISIENHQEKNQTVSIQNIEIRSFSKNLVQSFDFEPKHVELKSLENLVINFHLTNKTGYVGQGQVKAIVTYQIGNQFNEIESGFVEIDTH